MSTTADTRGGSGFAGHTTSTSTVRGAGTIGTNTTQLPSQVRGETSRRMSSVEWAAARMNSRFDRQLISRFLGLLSESEDAWTTLTTYIDCGAKISETAARLHVHENTVRYRLGQIEKKLNRRLSDPFTMADIVIAFESKRMEIAR